MRPPIKSYTLQMTLRCISFLALLAVLSFADFFILNHQIKTQSFDAALINIAGRQRLLFERSALLAGYLVNTKDIRERSNVRTQLLESIDQLDECEGILIRGNPNRNARGNPPPEIHKIYFDAPHLMHTRMQNYLTELKVLAGTRDEDLKPNDQRLTYIRTVTSGKVIGALDAVVNAYQNHNESKIARTQRLQRWVVESTLLVLLVLGIYLFRPMIKQVQRDMTKLEKLNEILEDRNRAQKHVEHAQRKTVADLAHSNQQLDLVGHELRNVNAQLEKLALLDPLTELLNRRGLQKALTGEIQRLNRDHSSLHAILVDLDDFKQINDTLGYPVGDIVLKEIAARLKDGLRSTDYVARIGGDEFMVLLPEGRRAEGLRVAEKIRFAIAENPILLSSGKAVKVTACLGFIEVPEDASSIDVLLNKIHPLLYRSKRTGKNRVSNTENGGEDEDAGEAAFLERFNALIQDHSLHAVRQPIFRLADTGARTATNS